VAKTRFEGQTPWFFFSPPARSSVFTKSRAGRWRGFSSSTTYGLYVWTRFVRKTTAHLADPQNSLTKSLL
jgi:hypothetical protein